MGGQGVGTEVALGFEGGLSESNIACACAMVRLVLYSQNPKRRKGIAVAAARSLARRGSFDSGSQRKGWAGKNNRVMAPRASEHSAGRTYTLQGSKDQEIRPCKSGTRQVAG